VALGAGAFWQVGVQLAEATALLGAKQEVFTEQLEKAPEHQTQFNEALAV